MADRFNMVVIVSKYPNKRHCSELEWLWLSMRNDSMTVLAYIRNDSTMLAVVVVVEVADDEYDRDGTTRTTNTY